jgi:hypothetical protein
MYIQKIVNKRNLIQSKKQKKSFKSGYKMIIIQEPKLSKINIDLKDFFWVVFYEKYYVSSPV